MPAVLAPRRSGQSIQNSRKSIPKIPPPKFTAQDGTQCRLLHKTPFKIPEKLRSAEHLQLHPGRRRPTPRQLLVQLQKRRHPPYRLRVLIRVRCFPARTRVDPLQAHPEHTGVVPPLRPRRYLQVTFPFTNKIEIL